MDVRLVTVAGSWPEGSDDDRGRLGAALQSEQLSIVDGIVASGSPETVLAAVGAGHVVVVLLHLPIADEAGLPAAVRRRYGVLESAALSSASGIICPSYWSAGHVSRRYGLTKVGVAVPGVWPAPRAPGSAADGAPRLLALAQLTTTKDQLTLVRALTRVRDLPWTAHLVGSVTADPVYTALVRAELEATGLVERVRVTGPVSGEALGWQWRQADLLLLTSRMETFGLVVTEALARGIPAVVAAGTGAVEALGSGRPGPGAPLPGRAVPPGNPAALAATLREWLTEPAVRRAWRDAAWSSRTRLPRWEHTARQVLDFLAGC
jgi:glycosyltransferase involved in cell wall biosynthesis